MPDNADFDITTEYLGIVNAAILKLELAADSGIAFVNKQKAQAAVIVSVTGNASSKVAFAATSALIDAEKPFSGELGAMFEKIIATVCDKKGENGAKDAPCIMLAGPASPAHADLPGFKGKIIIAFGNAAISALCGAEPMPIPGRFVIKESIRIMPTHGLLELAESAGLKKETWAHLKAVIAELAK